MVLRQALRKKKKKKTFFPVSLASQWNHMSQSGPMGYKCNLLVMPLKGEKVGPHLPLFSSSHWQEVDKVLSK